MVLAIESHRRSAEEAVPGWGIFIGLLQRQTSSLRGRTCLGFRGRSHRWRPGLLHPGNTGILYATGNNGRMSPM